MVRLDRYSADLLRFDNQRWESEHDWEVTSTKATETTLSAPHMKPLLRIFLHKKFADDLANRYKARVSRLFEDTRLGSCRLCQLLRIGYLVGQPTQRFARGPTWEYRSIR